MADLQYDVGVDVKDALAGVNKLQREFKDLRGEMSKTDRATKNTTTGFGNLKVAVAGIAVAMVAFKGIKIAAEFETLRATLKSVTGSTEQAAIAFSFIQDIAKGLPFDLQQVTTAYTKMTALGIAPTREALESFANTASATGKSLDQFVEAVADATTGEFERLKEFGIKVKSETDTLKVTFQGVEQTIGKDSAAIQGYLEAVGNTAFAGAAADQMDTLTGKWVNFVDQLATFADEASNTSGLFDLLKDALDLLSAAVQFLRDNFDDIGSFFTKDMPAAINTMLDALGPVGGVFRILSEDAVDNLSVMAEAFTTLFSDTRQLAIAFVDVVGQRILFLGKQWDILAEGMEFAWDTTVNTLRVTFNEFVNDFLSLWNDIATSSFGELAGLSGLQADLLDVTDTTESWASRMQRVNSEFDKNIAVHQTAIDMWHEETAAQNELAAIEKERIEVAKQLQLDEHNKQLQERQRLLAEQATSQRAAADAEKAHNAEIKIAVKDAESLATAYRTLTDPLGEIEEQENAITRAFEEQKISAEDYFAALDQLDIGRAEASQRMADDSIVWSDGWNRALTEYVASANDAASNAERVFGNAISGMEDAFISFTKTGMLNWRELADQIIEDLIRIQFRQAAAGLFGGGAGSGTDLFGGFFAKGGYLPAGQVGIVGERGPELINGPATITPLDKNTGTDGAAGANVTYNINAVDASSFRQLVAQDPEFIYSVTIEGSRGLPIK